MGKASFNSDEGDAFVETLNEYVPFEDDAYRPRFVYRFREVKY